MGRKAVSKFFYYNSIFLTILLAIVTIVGSFAFRVSPEHSLIISFLALAMSLLLIFNIFVAIYWIIRRRIWLIIPLIAITWNYRYIESLFEWHQQPQLIKQTNILKVATFNVDFFSHQWIAQSTHHIAKYMADNNVDILCFQEFSNGHNSFTLDSIRQAFRHWHYCIVPKIKGNNKLLQLAIFSRYPINNCYLKTFPNTANCSTWCDINIKGTKIRLFNIHLQTTWASRNLREIKRSNIFDAVQYTTEYVYNEMGQCFKMRALQAQYIRKRIDESPYPVIVCGDFNSLPSSYSYYTIMGKDLKDSFITCGKGYGYTYRYMKHLLRIDYIMASPALNEIEYNSPREDLFSDHNPVITTFSF